MPTRRIAIVAASIALSAVVTATGLAFVVTGASAAPAAVPAAAAVAAPTASTPEETGIPVATPRIVTIGDSIMAGLNLDSSQAWPALLSTSLGVPITNLGCSGAGFLAVGDCGDDYSGLIAAAVAANPDIVIIQSSDNDEGYSSAAIRDATTSTVAALRAALPNALIIGFSTLYDQPYTAPSEIAVSSAALSSAVGGVGGTFIDLGQPLRGHSALLQSDSEHPTVAGQQVLATTIQSALAAANIAL